ncbi:MAG: ATP-dependent zinc metalloprotease FtsH [Planctomycetota bacterium]
MPEPTRPTPPPPKQRGLLPVAMLVIGLMLFVAWMVGSNRGQDMAWSEFLRAVETGKVAKVELNEASAVVEMAGDPKTTRIVEYPGARLTEYEREQINKRSEVARADLGYEVVIDGAPPAGIWPTVLVNLLFIGVLIGLFYFLFLRRMGQSGGVLSFGKSRATLVGKGKSGKTFSDVAGVDEAKEEVEELVQFLRNPEKFQRLGGRIPRGVLLVGAPGTGKTLLAKAIAGEADVPFYSISGSDFVEMFVGVGASRVRDLFQQAKENSPCIIFIDEIDAVARKRSVGGATGGHDEREQTLNAILVEMDGFASNEKLIVMAATNRVDVLDPALLRPGRFDRHIFVDLPDIKGREQILHVHSKKVITDETVNLEVIARGTPGFSGADLANLVNEAALHAARKDRDTVCMRDMEYARDRVAFGREKKGRSRHMPAEEKKITAYHEAGHAIIQVLLPECDELHKVSIIPRGRALGMTMGLPKERYSKSRRDLLSDMCVLYGGRIAEERFCDDITSGASNDIERATQVARAMVYELGMSETMGPLKYTEQHDGLAGAESYVAVSEQTRRELDEEVRRFIDAEYERAGQLIDEHREQCERVALALLEWETLSAEQVHLLMQGGELGPRPSITKSITRPAAEADEARQERPDAPPAGGTLEPSLA